MCGRAIFSRLPNKPPATGTTENYDPNRKLFPQNCNHKIQKTTEKQSCTIWNKLSLVERRNITQTFRAAMLSERDYFVYGTPRAGLICKVDLACFRVLENVWATELAALMYKFVKDIGSIQLLEKIIAHKTKHQTERNSQINLENSNIS